MTLRIQYGGTYDPIHDGHLAVARAARDQLDADVWLMPAADPPHKPPTFATAEQRLAMLELAVAGQHRLAVDAREMHRAGPSYTIDTLHDLRIKLGDAAPLAILIGADSFLHLPTWRRWRELADLAHIVVAERPGHALDTHDFAPELADFAASRWADDLHDLPAGRLLKLDLPLRPESSSELRRRIAQHDLRWRGWTPPPVADYIAEHRLYRAG